MNNNVNRARTLEMASLAQLTYVAYKEGEAIVKTILNSGLQPFINSYKKIEFLHAPRLFNSRGELSTVGFLVSNPDYIVIAIRGTENLDDYFCNLLIQPNSEYIHSGFDIYVQSFWQQIQDFLLQEDNGSKNLFITGHSLGGAAATLIAKYVSQLRFKPIHPYALETYTFGAPPVSTVEFTLDTPLLRFRTSGDLIPHLPQIVVTLINRIPQLQNLIINWNPKLLSTLSKYRHTGNEYLIDKDDQIRHLEQPEIGKAWLWIQLTKVLLANLQLKIQKWEDKNNISNLLTEMITILIDTSLQEHRAIKYVEKLNYGQLPPWCKK
jgi:hypothetical protein